MSRELQKKKKMPAHTHMLSIGIELADKSPQVKGSVT